MRDYDGLSEVEPVSERVLVMFDETHERRPTDGRLSALVAPPRRLDQRMLSDRNDSTEFKISTRYSQKRRYLQR